MPFCYKTSAESVTGQRRLCELVHCSVFTLSSYVTSRGSMGVNDPIPEPGHFHTTTGRTSPLESVLTGAAVQFGHVVLTSAHRPSSSGSSSNRGTRPSRPALRPLSTDGAVAARHRRPRGSGGAFAPFSGAE